MLTGAAIAAFLLTRPEQVTVPQLVGKQAPDAAAALVNDGLKPKVFQVKSTRPVGLVVRQDPSAGQRLDKHSTVKLYVSNGPGYTTVPDVANKDRRVVMAKWLAEETSVVREYPAGALLHRALWDRDQD